jgi:hypothetical protein
MKKSQVIVPGVIVLPFLIFVICCCLQSCEKEDAQNTTTVIKDTTANQDKQVRLNFPYMSVGILGTSGRILAQEFWLIDFNKSNYANVDSIVFSASLESGDTTANCVAELFDVTDNTSVTNSFIETNKLNAVWVRSKNIFSGLPDKNIDLSIRVSLDKDVQYYGAIYDAVLLLYRK